ncbi:MAG: zinc ribbon domain-containing protein [Armatimonadetes bacterium]|nr:zinc ribbon domain-containing protein [Armatimonadota bacterium]
MPIYEFICAPCDSRFEILTSVSRASEAKCPKCGSGEVKRVMSMFAARTDGGGHSSNCVGCATGQCGSCGCGH